VINSYGGLKGLTQEGQTQIEAAIGRMQSGFGEDQFYPSILEKAAVLCHSIITSHPFADANKRTGFLSAVYFLHNNGFNITESEAFADIIIEVASDNAGYEHLVQWIQANAKEVTDTHGDALQKLTWADEVPRPPSVYNYSFTAFEHVYEHIGDIPDDNSPSVTDYDVTKGERRIFNEVRRILQQDEEFAKYVKVKKVEYDEMDSSNVHHAAAYFEVIISSKSLDLLVPAIRKLDAEMWLGQEDISDAELLEDINSESIGVEASKVLSWEQQPDGIIPFSPDFSYVSMSPQTRLEIMAANLRELDTATRDIMMIYLYEDRESGINQLKSEVELYADMSEESSIPFFTIMNYINNYGNNAYGLFRLSDAFKMIAEPIHDDEWELIPPTTGSSKLSWRVQEDPVVEPNAILRALQDELDKENLDVPESFPQSYTYVYPLTHDEYEYVRDNIMTDELSSPDAYRSYYIATRDIAGDTIFDLIGVDSIKTIDTLEVSLNINTIADIPGLERYGNLKFENTVINRLAL